MTRERLVMVVIAVCLGLLLTGCPKSKVAVPDESVRKSEAMEAAEKERAAKLEAERREKEAQEQARLKEEAERKAKAEMELQAEKERLAKLEAERAIREADLKAKEEEARRALAEKEAQAEKERLAKLEAERALREADLKAKEEAAKKAQTEKEKEFEKSLVAKKHPGIEGEVFESAQFKDIFFDYDSYDVRSADVENLQRIASLLQEHPTMKIQIEGHCDERGTQEYNLALGERRANSAREYLVTLGVVADRISIISYGEERPEDPGHTEEAYSKNRRAHFVILTK